MSMLCHLLFYFTLLQDCQRTALKLVYRDIIDCHHVNMARLYHNSGPEISSIRSSIEFLINNATGPLLWYNELIIISANEVIASSANNVFTVPDFASLHAFLVDWENVT